MPIQAPQWTDYLNCPVCCREFGPSPRSPVSLGCGHTLCRHCLNNLHKKQCPFDQTVIQFEPDDLVVNTALLKLAGHSPPAQPYHPPCIQALPERDQQAYDVIVRCLENLAAYLKYAAHGGNSRLSRPMQRKLVTLLQCSVTDEEGRGRMARAVRSLGERTVTELILQHQNPQQISAYLWAAVRARGCQFLGPAMQEEVLKLVLLALEDGSALSRKVLVMFVVQRLKPHFPQASKTSIGHVVQLLYRASCFKVSKRESDSSLMQLKEEFRTYDSLRREHDAQIVQIATESGLRIAPDQWSALLYGDTAHKSHMQSIIDKLQTPQSFSQSVQELFIALHRTGDPTRLVVMSIHLEKLAGIDASPDAKAPSWQHLAEVMSSLKEVISGLAQHMQQQNKDPNHNQKHIIVDRTDSSTSQLSPQSTNAPLKNDVPLPYRVNDEEVDRHHWIPPSNTQMINGNVYHNVQAPILAIPPPNLPQPIEAFNGNGNPNLLRAQAPMQPSIAMPNFFHGYAIPIQVRFPAIPASGAVPPNGEIPCPEMMQPQQFLPIPDHIAPRYINYGNLPEEQANAPNAIAYAQNARFAVYNAGPNYQLQAQEAATAMGVPGHANLFPANDEPQGAAIPAGMNGDMMNNHFFIPNPDPMPASFPRPEQQNMQFHGNEMMQNLVPVYQVPNNSPNGVQEMAAAADYRHIAPVFEGRMDAAWHQNPVFQFKEMHEMLPNNLPNLPSTSKGTYDAAVRRPMGPSQQQKADDDELKEELLALEKRISTEFKSTD